VFVSGESVVILLSFTCTDHGSPWIVPIMVILPVAHIANVFKLHISSVPISGAGDALMKVNHAGYVSFTTTFVASAGP